MKLRSVCLIASRMSFAQSRLQPWRYLGEVAQGLAACGHDVLLVSDGESAGEPAQGVQVCRLPSVHSPVLLGNRALRQVLTEFQPQVILQHLGLVSLLYEDFRFPSSAACAGLLTSPIYNFKDLLQLGPGKLLRNLHLSGIHLVGSCLPDWFVRERIECSRFDALVVQTQTTRQQLLGLGVRRKPVAVIPPGVDPRWHHPEVNATSLPTPCSTSQDRISFVYFGPAEELRGFDTLLKAFPAACEQDSALQLQVLLRQDTGGSFRKADFQEGRSTLPSCASIRIETQPLSSAELAARLAAADAAALPFELVSTDAPLSVIESAALGLPLVTTPVACLPELAGPAPHFFAQPGDPGSLALALLDAAAYVRENRKKGAGAVNAKQVRARSWEEVRQAWSELVQSL